MLNSILAGFFERDLRKLIEEINLFSNEDNLWRTQGSVKNSCGNLALHIIGGLNYLIGANWRKPGMFATATRNLFAKACPEMSWWPNWKNLFR